MYPAGVRFVATNLAWLIATAAIPIGLGSGLGRLGAVIGVAVALATTLWLWMWLPRSAHRAFERGRFARAARGYRLLATLAGTAERRRYALLSRAGCYVAAGELELAERLTQGIDGEDLAAAERAVWLNNRACAVLAVEGDGRVALALAEEASGLRPDVPALQHTRGMALLAVGRIDDAISVLDGMRAAGELAPHLEAERCRDLSRAWARKGEPAYAEDYRLRAEAMAR